METSTITAARSETEVPPSMTVEAYLAFERASPEKHEFINNHLILIGGASLLHNQISSNLHFLLRTALYKKDFQVFQSDMRVNNPLRKGYYYPDVVVVQGQPSLADQEFDNLLNPILIAEVLSEGTEAMDRGDKLDSYRSIATLHEYLLVATDKMQITQYQKIDEKNWKVTFLSHPEDILSLLQGTVFISLQELYADVVFAQPKP